MSKIKLHSLIKKYFPIEALIDLNYIIRSQYNQNDKIIVVNEVLDKYNIPYSKLGSGTNRYCVMIDGYAVKIALDRAGMTDNLREFNYAKNLGDCVVNVYETLKDGLIGVFSYIYFMDVAQFRDKGIKAEIRKILRRITEQFVVGDLGITEKNATNWGITRDGKIQALDFAYIYKTSYKLFNCKNRECDSQDLLQYDPNYTYLVCNTCGEKFSFSQIRRYITKEDEKEELKTVADLAYIITEDMEEVEFDPYKSDYNGNLKKALKKQKKAEEKERMKEMRKREVYSKGITFKDIPDSAVNMIANMVLRPKEYNYTMDEILGIV